MNIWVDHGNIVGIMISISERYGYIGYELLAIIGYKHI